MFTVNDAEAQAVCQAFDAGGELAAVVELQRYFPAITDDAVARRCVRTIVSWRRLPITAPPAHARRRPPNMVTE